MILPTIIYYPANANSGVVAGARIARWLERVIPGAKMYDGKTVEQAADLMEEKPHNLFIINVPKPMVAKVEQAERVVRAADTLIWVQNDYAIQTPTPYTNGVSIFTRAFTDRVKRKTGHGMQVWSSCMDRVERLLTMPAHYVNWNALAMQYQNPPVVKRKPYAIYWGAYRPQRQKSFVKYFGEPEDLHADGAPRISEIFRVSCTKNGADKFLATTGLSADCFMGTIEVPGDLYHFACTVYIEDEMSHRRFHSPANRFYEALSAGLPILVDTTAVGTLQKAGFTVPPAMQSTGLEDVQRLLAAGPGAWRKLARQQWELWGMDPKLKIPHDKALAGHVLNLMKLGKLANWKGKK